MLTPFLCVCLIVCPFPPPPPQQDMVDELLLVGFNPSFWHLTIHAIKEANTLCSYL